MLQGQPELCINSNHGDFSRLQAPSSPLQPEAVVLQIPDLCLHSKRSIHCFRQEQLLNLVKVIIPLEPYAGSDLESGLQGAPAAAASSIYEQGGSEAVASRDHADTNTVFYRTTAPILLQDKACYFVAVSDLKDMRWNPGGFSAYAAQKIICRGAEYWYLKRAGWRCEEEMEIHSFEEERCKAHKRRRVSNFVIGIKAGDQSDQDPSQSRFSSGPHMQGLFSTLKRDKRKDQFFVCMDISYWECDVVLESSQAASTPDQGLASEEPAAKRCNSGLALQSSDSKTDLGVQDSSELDFQSFENDWIFQGNLQLLQQSNDHQPTSSGILAGCCADMAIPGMAIPGMAILGMAIPGMAIPGMAIPGMAIPGIMTEMQEPAEPGMYSQLMCQDNEASQEEKSIQLLLAIHFNVEGPIHPAPSSVATDLETTSIAGNIDINSAALFKVLLQRETKITLMDLRLPPKSSVDRQPSINIVTEGNEQVGQPLSSADSAKPGYDPPFIHWILNPYFERLWDLDHYPDPQVPLDPAFQIHLLAACRDQVGGDAGFDELLQCRDRYKATAVHRACAVSHPLVVRWLLGVLSPEDVSTQYAILPRPHEPSLKLLLMFTNHGWLGIHDACRNCRLENAKAFVAALEKCLLGDRVRVQEALYKLQNKYFVKAGGNAMLEEACQVHGYYELKQAPEDAGAMAQVLCKITELSLG